MVTDNKGLCMGEASMAMVNVTVWQRASGGLCRRARLQGQMSQG